MAADAGLAPGRLVSSRRKAHSHQRHVWNCARVLDHSCQHNVDPCTRNIFREPGEARRSRSSESQRDSGYIGTRGCRWSARLVLHTSPSDVSDERQRRDISRPHAAVTSVARVRPFPSLSTLVAFQTHDTHRCVCSDTTPWARGLAAIAPRVHCRPSEPVRDVPHDFEVCYPPSIRG